MNAGKNTSNETQGIVRKSNVELVPIDALMNPVNQVLVGSRFDGMSPDDIPT